MNLSPDLSGWLPDYQIPKMKLNRFMLDENNNVVGTADIDKWSNWMSAARRIVKQTLYGSVVDQIAATFTGDRQQMVSTVFVGLSYTAEETPRLFETLVFGGELEGEQTMASTWEEAIRQHDAMVARVNGADCG